MSPANQRQRDEVDEVVRAWRRERPDLNPEPLHLWSRIARLAKTLEQVRAKAYAAHDLQSWEFDVLAALRRAGEPYRLTPGQLLTETQVTSGTMTNRVDGLVKRGLVARMANPADGRGVIVELTEAGKELVDAAMVDLIAAENKLMANISPTEFNQLAALLRKTLLGIRQA